MTTKEDNRIVIEWLGTDLRDEGKADACWYVEGVSYVICTVSNGKRSFEILVNGEMSVNYWEPLVRLDGTLVYGPAQLVDGESVTDTYPYHERIRYSEDWDLTGCKNDADVFDASEKGMIEWDMNPWFEICSTNEDEWWDVAHDLTDAIAKAELLLLESEGT